MYGDVSLRFDARGMRQYAGHSAAKEQVMFLTYRVDGEWLVTDSRRRPVNIGRGTPCRPTIGLLWRTPKGRPPVCRRRIALPY